MGTFVRNSFWTISAQGVIFAVGVFTSIIMARTLGPDGKGLYTLALFLPSFLMYFVNLNIGQASVFYIGNGKYPARIVLGNSMICALGHSSIAVLMGISIIYFTREYLFADVPVKYLFLSLLIAPSHLFISFILPIFLGRQKIRAYNLLRVLTPIFTLGLIIVFLLGLKMEVAGGIIAVAIAAYFTCIILFYFVLRDIGGISFRIDKGYLKDAYLYGGKLQIGTVLSFLGLRLNIILVNWYMNPVMVGFFSLASALSEKVCLIGDATGTVLFSKVASERNQGKGNSFSLLVFRTTLVMTTLVSVFLYIVGGRLIELLYSSAFLESVQPFRLLLVGAVAGSGSRILQNDLKGRGKPGLITITMAGSCATNVLFSIVLIPRYGLMGASWAVVISAGLSLLMGIIFFSRVSGNKIMKLFVFTKSDAIAYRNLLSSLMARIGCRM